MKFEYEQRMTNLIEKVTAKLNRWESLYAHDLENERAAVEMVKIRLESECLFILTGILGKYGN